MASSYSTDLSLELITTGEKAGQWGTITNTNLQILQRAASGYVAVPMTSGTDVTLSLADGSDTANGKNLFLELTGTMTASINLIIPAATTGGTATRTYIIKDSTARTNSHFTILIKTAASTSPVPLPEGANIIVRSDGTNTITAFIQPGMKIVDSANTTNYTSVNGDQIEVSTSSTTVVINLPITPAIKDEVIIMDGSATNGFATNAVTVNRNGSNINGAATDYVMNVNNQCVTFVYVNATKGWLLKSTNQ